jgi:hypothetical protein
MIGGRDGDPMGVCGGEADFESADIAAIALAAWLASGGPDGLKVSALVTSIATTGDEVAVIDGDLRDLTLSTTSVGLVSIPEEIAADLLLIKFVVDFTDFRACAAGVVEDSITGML